MKNIIIVAIVLIASIQTVSSQISFSHSAGGTYLLSSSENSTVGLPGGTYSPRLNLYQISDDMNVSFGTHLTLAISANSQEGVSSFAFDLPLVAEFNFGHASSDNTDMGFGFFGGFGYGISSVGASSTSYYVGTSSTSNKASGLVMNGGLRFMFRDIYSAGVRASYLINSKEGGANVIGVGVFYNFL